MYNIGFTLGDPYEDGHGKYKTFHIECNYSVEDITAAYKDAVKLLGFDYVETVCAEYEDYYIHENETDILLKYGIIKEEDINRNVIDNYNYCPKDCYILDEDEYVEIFFKIVKLILPDIVYKNRDLNETQLNLLHCAAYGIFGE